MDFRLPPKNPLTSVTGSVNSLTDRIQRLQEENEQLKSLVGGKEIVARTKLPGGLTQVVYRNKDSHARAN